MNLVKTIRVDAFSDHTALSIIADDGQEETIIYNSESFLKFAHGLQFEFAYKYPRSNFVYDEILFEIKYKLKWDYFLI